MRDVYSETLQCYLQEVHVYQMGSGSVVVSLMLGGPCDMRGAINAAVGLGVDPQVIRTFIDGVADTEYWRKKDGNWQAATPR